MLTQIGETTSRLQVRVIGDEERSVVEAHGAVDQVTAARLGTILRAAAYQPDSMVVLDLRSTTHLETSALEALLRAHAALPAKPSWFEVQVCAGSQPEDLLRSSQAHEHFSVVVWTGPPCGQSVPHVDETRGSLELRIPSDVCQVSRVRRLVEQVMLLTGVDDWWLSDFVTAIGEAVANAVTHGSPHGFPQFVIFRLRPGPLVATAEIEDFGPGIANWQGHPVMPPPDSIRGRGLGMMEILADRLQVDTHPGSTLVRLNKYHGHGVAPSECS